MTDPTPIDLGRMQSTLLTEVRTVLSRAETALGSGQWIQEAELHIKPGVFRRLPDATEPPFCAHVGRESIPHPEREEILQALEKVVELLAPWRKTGTPLNRQKV